LPGHQRRLTLRQDQDPSRELDPLRHPGEIREHHERVVKRIPFGIGTGQRWRPASVDGAEDMVIGEQVVKAQLLDRPAKWQDSCRVSTKLDLRIHHTDLHTRTLPRCPWTQHQKQSTLADHVTADVRVGRHERALPPSRRHRVPNAGSRRSVAGRQRGHRRLDGRLVLCAACPDTL